MADYLNQHSDLWQRISNFRLDEPEVSFPFSKKLAKENNWTESFAQRAIEEYKRFIFLCTIATDGASPSEVVDKVWHLHLTYTKSYWEDLCGKTVHKAIHHYPSKGGHQESQKHIEWYLKTLEFYEKVFNQKPPPDIWILSLQPHVEPLEFSYYGEFNSSDLVQSSIILSLPFIFIFIFFSRINPYGLYGPEFLVFYLLLIICTLVVVYIKHLKSAEGIKAMVEHLYPQNYTVFQASKFLYGKHRALQTAIVDLLKKDVLELTPDRQFINHAPVRFTDRFVNPLLPVLKDRNAYEKLTYETLEKVVYDEESFSHPVFSKMYDVANSKKVWPIVLFGIVLLVGLARVFQGTRNDKPIGYLVLSMIVFAVIFWKSYKKWSDQSTVFKRAEQKFYNDDLSAMGQPEHGEILRTFSIYGAEFIAGFREFASLSILFAAYPAIDRNFFGSTTNSDSGTSGCGSCSGGSCGGGCGGCGGGD